MFYSIPAIIEAASSPTRNARLCKIIEIALMICLTNLHEGNNILREFQSHLDLEHEGIRAPTPEHVSEAEEAAADSLQAVGFER